MRAWHGIRTSVRGGGGDESPARQSTVAERKPSDSSRRRIDRFSSERGFRMGLKAWRKMADGTRTAVRLRLGVTAGNETAVPRTDTGAVRRPADGSRRNGYAHQERWPLTADDFTVNVASTASASPQFILRLGVRTPHEARIRRPAGVSTATHARHRTRLTSTACDPFVTLDAGAGVRA